jgi:FAD/FMN-containing dehydrogenase
MAAGITAHLARLAAATRRFRTGETFVNFMELDPTRDQVRAAYSPADWERLTALKTKHDPHNLFRFNRNIPPRADGLR